MFPVVTTVISVFKWESSSSEVIHSDGFTFYEWKYEPTWISSVRFLDLQSFHVMMPFTLDRYWSFILISWSRRTAVRSLVYQQNYVIVLWNEPNDEEWFVKTSRFTLLHVDVFSNIASHSEYFYLTWSWLGAARMSTSSGLSGIFENSVKETASWVCRLWF